MSSWNANTKHFSTPHVPRPALRKCICCQRSSWPAGRSGGAEQHGICKATRAAVMGRWQLTAIVSHEHSCRDRCAAGCGRGRDGVTVCWGGRKATGWHNQHSQCTKLLTKWKLIDGNVRWGTAQVGNRCENNANVGTAGRGMGRCSGVQLRVGALVF